MRIPTDVSRGSLTVEEVGAMEDALTRHYGERVASVSNYCKGFYDWRDAIDSKLKRMDAGDEDGHEADYWRRISEALQVIYLPILKSSMLDRRIYGGEALRTRMCPVHKGHWVGLPYGPTPCGCGLTGWLPQSYVGV